MLFLSKSVVKPKNNAGFKPVFVQSVHGGKDGMPSDSPIKVASIRLRMGILPQHNIRFYF